MPAAFTVAAEVLPPETMPPPVQLYVAPGVDELAVMVPLAVIQSRLNALPVLISGRAPLFVTSTVAVAVHPFEGSVTVTVYVPAMFTVGADVAAPAVMPGPDQL